MSASVSVLPANFWIVAAPLVALWIAGTLGPVAFPAWLAWHKKLPRPLLFIGVCSALTYGSLLLLAIAVLLPASIFGGIGALTLKINHAPFGSSIFEMVEFLKVWRNVILPAFAAAWSVVGARLLAKHWLGIAASLHDSTTTRSTKNDA